MFTGIVEELGTVATAARGGRVARLEVRARATLEETAVGGSLAVNGACLTIVERRPDGFVFELGPETLARTTLGRLPIGRRLNLERALKLGDRLGGHVVQGHVDAVGRLEAITPNGDWLAYRFSAPRAVWPYLVEKGAIAVDGVSLTVFACRAALFTVALIPHTLAVTTLADLKPGDRVNLEADVLLKQIRGMLRARRPVVG